MGYIALFFILFSFGGVLLSSYLSTAQVTLFAVGITALSWFMRR